MLSPLVGGHHGFFFALSQQKSKNITWRTIDKKVSDHQLEVRFTILEFLNF
jgi:hypothetical protein